MNANKLKEVRTRRGMSISELARRSKVSRMTIHEIESGDSNPTAKTIESICKALDENPNNIFFTHFVNHEYQ